MQVLRESVKASTMLSVIPKLEQLSHRIIRVLGNNPGPMTLQGTNTYLVGTGKNRLLIDTGEEGDTAKLYSKELQSCLNEHNISIQAVVLTHWHHDHVGGLQQLLYDKIINVKTPLYKYPLSKDETPPCKGMVYTFVKDSNVIETEGATLKVMFTPGHTTDHVALYLQEENAVFSGDCILGEGTAVFEDLFDYMKSLAKIASFSPSVIYPSHGKVVTEPSAYIRHYIEHRNKRESQIVSCLEKFHPTSMEPMQLVKEIYSDVPVALHLPAAKNVCNHLEKLKKEGKANEDNGKWKLSKL